MKINFTKTTKAGVVRVQETLTVGAYGLLYNKDGTESDRLPPLSATEILDLQNGKELSWLTGATRTSLRAVPDEEPKELEEQESSIEMYTCHSGGC